MKNLFEFLKHKSIGLYLTLFFVLGILAWFGGYALVTGKSLDGAQSIIAPFAMIAAGIQGYKWGSSEGSKKKQELLEKLNK